MATRVTSDDLETHRAEIARLGSTRTRCLRLPDAVDDELSDGDFIRLVIDRAERHARVETDARGRLLRGAFAFKREARAGRGEENYLATWLAALDREVGDGVDLDAVIPGELYGLRRPGNRAVYDAVSGPTESLSSIAERLDGGE